MDFTAELKALYVFSLDHHRIGATDLEAFVQPLKNVFLNIAWHLANG